MISIRNAKFAKIGLMDMCDYIGDMSNLTMVEIGCYVGDSTAIFADRAKHLYCIDPWQNGYDDNDGASSQHPMDIIESQFDDLLVHYQNIAKMKMTSNYASFLFDDESIDVVYIDGLHTYEGCKDDIAHWLPKVKKGGYICGHDYGSRHFPGVKRAVDEYFKPNQTFRDSSWLVKL